MAAYGDRPPRSREGLLAQSTKRAAAGLPRWGAPMESFLVTCVGSLFEGWERRHPQAPPPEQYRGDGLHQPRGAGQVPLLTDVATVEDGLCPSPMPGAQETYRR